MHPNKNNLLMPVRNFLTKISQQTEETNPPYVVFGIFGLITYPLYHLIWLLATPQGYESLILRLVATALCLPLAFKNILSKKLDKYLPLSMRQDVEEARDRYALTGAAGNASYRRAI